MPRQFQFRNEDGHETVEIAVRGRQVLARPMLNRGSAFTLEQRQGDTVLTETWLYLWTPPHA